MSNTHTGAYPAPASIDLARLLDSHPLPIWLIDGWNFTIKHANQAARRFTAPFTSGLLTFLDLFTERSRLMLSDQLKEVRPDGVYQLNTGKLAPRFVELYVAAGEGGQIQVTAIEVTARMEIQQALEEERERYKSYIRNSAAGIYCQELHVPISIDRSEEELLEHFKRHGYLSECNMALAHMYGFDDPSEMMGLLPYQMIDFSDPKNIEFLLGFIRNGFVAQNAESHEKDRFGNDKYFHNNAIGIVEEGMIKRIWGSQIDITERKRSEEREKLLVTLVEQTSDILTSADLDYRPLSWNKAAERVYGLKAEEVIGKDLREFITMEYRGATREEVRETIQREGEWRGEAYFNRPSDGKKITLLGCFKLLKNIHGVPAQLVVSATDITERTEADARLKESESRFRFMADSAPVMIWVSNEKGKVIYLNQAWLQFTGVDISNGTTKTWLEVMHPDDRDKALRLWGDAYSDKKPINFVYRLRTREGNYRWVKDVSTPRFLADGSFMGYIGSLVDVDDQKRTEEQLCYQATVLENVSDIVVTTDLDFAIRGWNSVAEHYYGIKEEDAIGHKASQLVEFTFYSGSLDDAIQSLLQFDVWHGETSFAGRNGETYFFLHTLKGLFNSEGQKIGYLSIGRDITERKKMEQKLLKSEQFYRTLIADSLYGTLLLNGSGDIQFCSAAIRHILGYEPEDVQGLNAFAFVHPQDLQLADASFQNEVTETPEVKFISVRLRRKDGDWNWCLLRGHNLLKNPSIGSIVVYIHDDTARKKASDALKESERRFRELIRDLRLGVMLLDRNGSIILCNQAACKQLGASEEILLGLGSAGPEWNIIGEDGKIFTQMDIPGYQAIQTGKPVRDVVMGIVRQECKERVWLLINAEPIFNEGGELLHVICSMTDITERKKLEQTLLADQIIHQKQLTKATIDGQEKERREIGRELHDNIGQQLTTIKLFLEMAQSQQCEAAAEMLKLAMKGVKDVINDVRSMSHALIPHTLKDLGLVESIVELVEAVILTQRIEVNFDHQSFTTGLLPDSQKLTVFRIVQEQLNNIVKHAGARRIDISLSNNDEVVKLYIQDDGKGFDPAKVKKGLGLTNMRNRVELFNGMAEIKSKPGKGCLLRISMPLVSE